MRIITLDELKDMFAQIHENTDWNLEGDLLWSYYFTDTDPDKLKPLAAQLEKQGYHVVNIYPTDDGQTYFLHVEKIEHHTPESLNQRNHDFYKMAIEYDVESYDGMDVGPVNP